MSQDLTLVFALVFATRHQGETPPDHLDEVRSDMNHLVSGPVTHLESRAPLSTQELAVALTIKNGMSSDQMADHLQLSVQTVKPHRRNMRRKLGLTDSTHKLGLYLIGLGVSEPIQGGSRC